MQEMYGLALCVKTVELPPPPPSSPSPLRWFSLQISIAARHN